MIERDDDSKKSHRALVRVPMNLAHRTYPLPARGERGSASLRSEPRNHSSWARAIRQPSDVRRRSKDSVEKKILSGIFFPPPIVSVSWTRGGPNCPTATWWSIVMVDTSERTTKAWVLALASVASFMVFLDAMVVATVLGTIRRELGASI